MIRILTKVFEQPWMIRPETHRTIQRTVLEKLTNGKVEIPEGPETPDEPVPIPQEEESKVEAPSVAIIQVDGILGKHLSMLEMLCGGYDVDMLAQALKEARDNPSVKAIILWINSPGGTVTGIPEVAELIAEVDKIKPVIAYTDSQCCSGGYYLASQCSTILAAPSADVGSIGVYMALLDESARLDMEGLKVNAISAGKFKLAGASFKPLTDEERAMFQEGIDRIYKQFTAAVNSKRTISSDNMQGQVWDGALSVEKGLVDGLANDLDECIKLVLSELTTNV